MPSKYTLVLTSILVTAVSNFVPSSTGVVRSTEPPENLQLVVELQETPLVPLISYREQEAVKKVVENRINALGIKEALIQIKGKKQIFVQLPGVKDPAPVVKLLEKTAKLEFKKQKPKTNTQLFKYIAIQDELKATRQRLQNSKNTDAIAKNQAALKINSQKIAKLFETTNPAWNGAYLKDADAVEPAPGINWEIIIRFDDFGTKLFADLTKSIAGTGRSIGIFLDNEIISAPIVGAEYKNNGITGGAAVITGKFSAREAQDLSVQLRGGALPIPVKVKVIQEK